MNPHPSTDHELLVSLQKLARTELSSRSRLGHVVLILAAMTMTIVIASLWMTEPALPIRTSVAFALLTAIGIAWTSFGAWVLSTRRPMLATQRLVASRLAVAFSLLFTSGCLVLAVLSAQPSAWPAGGMGAAMSLVAVALWRRAASAHATLVARRDALAAALGREVAR